MSNRVKSFSNSTLAMVSASLLLSGLVGCKSTGGSNYVTSADDQRISTPSVENVRSEEIPAFVRSRSYELTPVSSKMGTVTHTPLYYQDPCEFPGQTLTFTWDGEDYFHLVYGPVRFLASTFLFPVSAVVTPPWQEMESDGQMVLASDGPNP